MPGNHEKMLSIKETAELLGMGVSTLAKKLHRCPEGIIIKNKRTLIPLSSIPEIKRLLNYNDEFDRRIYYSSFEAANKFTESGLRVKRTDINFAYGLPIYS